MECQLDVTGGVSLPTMHFPSVTAADQAMFGMHARSTLLVLLYCKYTMISNTASIIALRSAVCSIRFVGVP